MTATGFVIFRLSDVIARGNLKYAFEATHVAFFFWLETLLFMGPWLLHLFRTRITELQRLLGSGMLVVTAGAIYNPPAFPSGTVEGMGFHETPRGTLSHWVVIDNGKIKNYQAVVPTTWNASPRDDRLLHSRRDRAAPDRHPARAARSVAR